MEPAEDGGLRQGPTVLIATAGLWFANVVVVTLAASASGVDDQLHRLALRLALAGFGCALCLGMHGALELLALKRFRTRALVTLVLALVAAGVHLAANAAVLHVADYPAPAGGQALAINIIMYGFWAWFFLAWAAFYLAVDYGAKEHRHAQERMQIGIAARDAQLRALRYQVQPHFLFNTLNSLSALIMDRKPEQAELMIERLSAFLRTTLDDNPSGFRDLASELAHQTLYLEIEQARRPGLEVQIELPEALRAVQVPDFLFQPLIENAVRYSAADSGKANIRLTTHAEDNHLVVSVVNTIGRTHTSGFGIGLANVRERLALITGGAGQFAAGARTDGFYEVRLSLPLDLS